MKNTIIILIVTLLGGLAAGCAKSAGDTVKSGSAKISPNDIIDEKFNITLPGPDIAVQNPEIPGFTRGINLGNGLDAPTIGEWGVILEENHFKYAAEAGLDHVRLPVRFSAWAEKQSPYTIKPDFFARVDWALDMAEKYKLSILLDLHHYEELMQDPHNHMDRYLGMWKQIAERYKDRPATVAFELLNEPCDKLTNDLLNPLMKKAHALVRETNPDRLVFINSYFWANTEWLDKMDVSFYDANTVATFHMYQPILFTHQKAGWMPPIYRAAPKVVFPGPPAERVEITDAMMKEDWVADWFQSYNVLPVESNPSGPATIWTEFDRVTAFVQKTGVRTYLGEFGCINLADAKSRQVFLKMVRKEAERRGVGWAYWDDGGHNKGIDIESGVWVPLVKDALFGQ